MEEETMSSIFGEILTFPQEKGPDVKLLVQGDEFYARYENLDGYTVVFDTDRGLFCYAMLINNELVSTGVEMGKSPPAGIKRHFKESEEVRNTKFLRRFARMKPPTPYFKASPTMKTLGPEKGLLEGRRVSEGKVRGLTVLVHFQDVTSSATKADVEALLNGTGYHENGNFCSVREYYKLMSGGKLDYTNEVVGPITLSHNRYYYTKHLLVEEALDLAVQGGLDLTKFDSLNEGVVDAMSFLYAGQTQYVDDLWPHNSDIDLRYGNMKTFFYMLSSMGRTKEDLSIGTFCHESGHMICRWPDLYDYGTRDGDFQSSAGLGYYCLMAAGNHNDYGRTPAPVCSYLRYLMGWPDKVVSLNKPGQFTAQQGDYATVLQYETGKINEYFLVENRTQLDLDEHIPASGLAVLHCDILGSNEWQGGTPNRHYQCGLIQADGNLDLETNNNLGDENDLFGKVEGIALSHFTKPSSVLWDDSESGLIISQVSKQGKSITFTVGKAEIGRLVKKESSPKVAIPDKDVTGVTDELTLEEDGRVQKIKVSVEIDHENIGNLRVDLTSPKGKKALLHNRKEKGKKNLAKTFDSDSSSTLAALIGQPTQGTWKLRVKDYVKGEKGTLKKWGLELTC
jgi:M6 family metalloprotease-like protein